MVLKYGTMVNIINFPFFEDITGIVIDVENTGLIAEDRDGFVFRYLVNFGSYDRWFLETNVVKENDVR